MTYEDIIHNMVGTAYNVLMEQEHPDLKEFETALRTHGVATVSFDLRYRDLGGKVLR